MNLGSNTTSQMNQAQLGSLTGLTNPLLSSLAGAGSVQTPQVSLPAMPMTESETPESLTSPYFTPAFLRTQIGKLMRVEFLIGNATTDRVGRLAQVGASYIILMSLDNQSFIMCDLFSIKFVTVIDGQLPDDHLLGS